MAPTRASHSRGGRPRCGSARPELALARPSHALLRRSDPRRPSGAAWAVALRREEPRPQCCLGPEVRTELSTDSQPGSLLQAVEQRAHFALLFEGNAGARPARAA